MGIVRHNFCQQLHTGLFDGDHWVLAVLNGVEEVEGADAHDDEEVVVGLVEALFEEVGGAFDFSGVGCEGATVTVDEVIVGVVGLHVLLFCVCVTLSRLIFLFCITTLG